MAFSKRPSAAFRTLCVFVVMEMRIAVGSPPQCHWPSHGGTDTAVFREALPGDHAYRLIIHDLDSIFAKEVDEGS